MNVGGHIVEHYILNDSFAPNYRVSSSSQLTSILNSLDGATIEVGPEINITGTVGFGGAAVSTGTGVFNVMLDPGQVYIHSLIRFKVAGAWGNWFKIRDIVDADTIKLYEKGAAIADSFSAYQRGIIQYKVLRVASGKYVLDGVSLPIGVSIIGDSEHSTSIVELTPATALAAPFVNFGENFFANLRLGAIPELTTSTTYKTGALDGAFGTASRIHAGARSYFRNVIWESQDVNGTHQGGSVSYPVLQNGFIQFDNVHFKTARAFAASLQPAAPGNYSTTRLRFNSCTWERVSDHVKPDTNLISPSLLIVPPNTIIDINNGNMLWEDKAYTGAALGKTSAIMLATTSFPYNSSAGSTLNINGLTLDVADASVSINAVECAEATATVNIMAADIKATGAAANGLKVSAGTVNVRNSRIKGQLNSVIQTGGTVNIGKGVQLDGPVTGTLSSTVRGVATLVGGTVTVNTSLIKANSRVHLTRQTLGGTPGHLSLGTVTSGTSFVINSSSGSDTSVVLWEIDQ